MPKTPINPIELAPPAASYHHAVLTEGCSRLLTSSGVVPVAGDGSVPGDLGRQAEVVWANIEAMLAEAEMSVGDIVSVITYVIPGEDLAAVMVARDRALGGHRAASTLVIVAALARPEWKVEIAVVAAS